MQLDAQFASDVESLLRTAGELLLSWWPGNVKRRGDLEIHHKPDGTRVTNADMASNEVVIAGLQNILPAVPIISEELPIDPVVHSADLVWIIDPLDGTTSFIEGRDDFSILVSLVERERPIFGAMYFPQKKLYGSAIIGQGAYLNGSRIAVNDLSRIRPGKLALSKMELPDCSMVYPLPIDSGMAFFDVARGTLDAFIICIKTHREWDIAAPHVILSESGGCLSDEHGAPLRFNQPRMLWRHVVAGNPSCHQEALSLLTRG